MKIIDTVDFFRDMLSNDILNRLNKAHKEYPQHTKKDAQIRCLVKIINQNNFCTNTKHAIAAQVDVNTNEIVGFQRDTGND